MREDSRVGEGMDEDEDESEVKFLSIFSASFFFLGGSVEGKGLKYSRKRQTKEEEKERK